MARLYRRNGSPYWQLEHRKNGKLTRTSTKCHIGPGDKAAKAMLRKARKAEEEEGGMDRGSHWSAWVEDWLRGWTEGRPATRKAYLLRWATLSRFLESLGVEYPCQLRYAHVVRYVDWRKGEGVKHNTARTEVCTLGLIMAEAMRREFTQVNSCRGLRIHSEPRKVKPEIQPADAIKIRRHLMTLEPEWSLQFELAMHTGCRLAETYFPFERVNFDTATLTLLRKGGRLEPVPISAPLMAMLEQARAGGKTRSIESLPGASLMSCKWRRLFEKLGMPYTFHCIRNTFINACRRAGMDRFTLLRLVGHSSVAVNDVYQRYEVDRDLRAALATVDVGAPANLLPMVPAPAAEPDKPAHSQP